MRPDVVGRGWSQAMTRGGDDRPGGLPVRLRVARLTA